MLARYFQGRGLLGDLDFAKLGEAQSDELFAAWLELSEEDRKAVEAAFREIFELSCEKGAAAILDEARWQWRDDPGGLTAFVEEFSALPGHYDRAMAAYLDHPECWTGAARFYHADALPHWRKRKHLGHRPAAVDTASLEHLADLIRTYFHSSEGRGNHCVVESYRRRELDYFFAYPEDYSQQQIEWIDGAFGRRPHTARLRGGLRLLPAGRHAGSELRRPLPGRGAAAGDVRNGHSEAGTAAARSHR